MVPAREEDADSMDSAVGRPCCLRGRLVEWCAGRGLLLHAGGETWFTDVHGGIKIGDILQIKGCWAGSSLQVDSIIQLTSAGRVPWGGVLNWRGHHERIAKLRTNLTLRQAVGDAVRAFFDSRNFTAVETPSLVSGSSQDAHLDLFETVHIGKLPRSCWLTTSPELHMKRMLVDGWERIYQIGRCFRNGEVTTFHNPEFTMVEWYRAYANYHEVVADVEQLVAYVAVEVLGTTKILRRGREIELRPPWRRLTLKEAFLEFADLEIVRWADEDLNMGHALELGLPSIETADDWETTVYKLLVEKVEPALAVGPPTFVAEYPAAMASLARISQRDPDVAERVEAFVGGLELANGFSELTDPQEQRRRFDLERQKRWTMGKGLQPQDEEFLQALEQGMPPAAGMALGLDRLVMLVLGAADIGEVLAFSTEAY